MHRSKNRCFWLAAVVIAVIFMSNTGWATTVKNCPAEPAQNVPIASGVTYSGGNCTISNTGDVESFVFTAAAGDIWDVTIGLTPAPTANACVSLYAPGSTTPLVTSCTNIGFGPTLAAGFVEKLAAAGTYTIVVTDGSNATIGYDLSLERILPAAPDSVPLILNKDPGYTITPATAMNAFTFSGNTADTYKLTASVPSSATSNICFNIYQPDGTNIVNGACTNIGFGPTLTVSAQVTPAQNGTFVAIVYTGGNDSTQAYNVELSCLLGADGCKQPQPKCILSETPSYNASTGTLTMNFTLGTPVAATWNGWLVSGNTVQSMWSQAEPITEPPVTVAKTQLNVAKSGNVGILSTLNAASGITCNSWVLVNTAK